MRKVIFSKDISKISIDELPEDTLIVVHEMYDKPNIDRQTIDWQRFRATYPEYTTSQFVLVGVNRMINPQNRCDMVNDYLQTLTLKTPKVCIDTTPFIGEPWRMWFHYSIAFGKWMGVHYSYPIEGEWLKWFYYEINECKFSKENLPILIHDTETDIDKLSTSFSLYEPTEMDIEYYAETKKIVFEKYDTPKLLVNNLLKHCNKHFGLDIDFDSYLKNRAFFAPDLGVYRFLFEENKRRLNIYNCVAK